MDVEGVALLMDRLPTNAISLAIVIGRFSRNFQAPLLGSNLLAVLRETLRQRQRAVGLAQLDHDFTGSGVDAEVWRPDESRTALEAMCGGRGIRLVLLFGSVGS